jgi:hypothetical protein
MTRRDLPSGRSDQHGDSGSSQGSGLERLGLRRVGRPRGLQRPIGPLATSGRLEWS